MCYTTVGTKLEKISCILGVRTSESMARTELTSTWHCTLGQRMDQSEGVARGWVSWAALLPVTGGSAAKETQVDSPA